jgi:hypothetical protein
MASHYNWDYYNIETGVKGRYEDDKGNEVSWNKVENQYSLGSSNQLNEEENDGDPNNQGNTGEGGPKKKPAEQGGNRTLNNLSNAVSAADYGVSLAGIGGYNATAGVWRDLSKLRYYPSGWNGSNQYVWKTFNVAEGASTFFYGANLFLEYPKFKYTGQSGLEIGSNMGVVQHH